MPKALPVNWEAIRVEFSHGVSQPELARKYGIKEGTIAARSARQGWMQTRPTTHVRPLQDAQIEAARSVGMNLAERGQAYAARVFDRTSKAMEATPIPKVRSIKDLELLDKIARRAAGLDTADVNIQTVIGVGGFEESPVLAPVMGAEVVNNPSAD